MPDGPNYVRIFQRLNFDYQSDTGNEVFGGCPFCRRSKFYINRETGLWSCKAGDCAREGNVYTFLTQWYDYTKQLDQLNFAKYPDVWERLAANRGIGIGTLMAAGVIFDVHSGKFAIPIYNTKGVLVNLRTYILGNQLMQLPELPAAIWNAQCLSGEQDLIYITEGEWDGIALAAALSSATSAPSRPCAGCQSSAVCTGGSSAVVAVPGSAAFKKDWIPLFSGKEVVLCYDNDDAGRSGAVRVANFLARTTKHIWSLRWPEELPDGYDVRDFYKTMQPVRELQKYITDDNGRIFMPGQVGRNGAQKAPSAAPALPPEAKYEAHTASDTNSGGENSRAHSLISVLRRYGKWLHMDTDYETAIRLTYAVCLSQSMPGDPLWLYLVGPPSCGKTVILQSLSKVPYCVLKSSLTVHSLVSGMRTQDGNDPSLIPQLDGNVFVLKDFTEVLALPAAFRGEIYATLRGAYDQNVERVYGNGVTRRYTPHFSTIAGVTQAIFADTAASLGERFLMYHMVRGNNDNDDAIMRALSNVGDDDELKEDLANCAAEYLSAPVHPGVVQQVEATATDEFHHRVVGLAQLVAMLRGQVEREYRNDQLLYRPQVEIGARLAKQLKKLAIALGILENPVGINDNVFQIIARVALDTCVGFHLDIFQALLLGTEMDIAELGDVAGIPLGTLRARLDDMMQLGVVTILKRDNPSGRGAPINVYTLSNRARENWNKARIDTDEFGSRTVAVKIRRRKKSV